MIRKFQALLLAGLLLPGILWGPMAARAGESETVTIAGTEYPVFEVNGEKIIPIKCDNILTTPQYYDSLRYIMCYDIYHCNVKIDNRRVLLYADFQQMHYDANALKGEIERINYLQTIKLVEEFGVEFKPKGKGSINLYTDIVSLIPIGFEYYDDSVGRSIFYPNKKGFFNQVNFEDIDNSPYSFFSSYYEKYANDELVAKALSKEKLTIDELRKIYMTVFPKSFWPAYFIPEKYENMTLPQLTEEELDESVIENYMGILNIVTKEKNKEEKMNYILVEEKILEQKMYDFFSGDCIGNPDKGEYNPEYLKKIGIDPKTIQFKHFVYFKGTTKNLIYGMDENLLLFFSNVKTKKDAIEFYQLLPNQIDYSNFDFTNNPRFVSP